jgi:hypothetical protein
LKAGIWERGRLKQGTTIDNLISFLLQGPDAAQMRKDFCGW